MTNSQLISRRELLVSLSASALLPYPAILSAAENKMRGALMILSTPYTDDNQVDFEDLAKEVRFCAQCGVQGVVWPQNSSEQRYLSSQERMKGFEVIAEASRGTGMSVVFGVQADDFAFPAARGSSADRLPLDHGT